MAENDNDLYKPITNDEIANLETIEQLFFAYRDFVSDPDIMLNNLGFGRAHHRVLYFVSREPGMSVAELLSILKITKQSLGRVLKQLIDSGYIVQNAGEKDKRKRLLYPTPKGRGLIRALSAPQSIRIERAFSKMNEAERATVSKFLNAMIQPKKR